MKSLLKLSFVALMFALVAGSCSKESKSGESSDGDKGSSTGITTLEGQLGVPGNLNGYVELVPGDVNLEYSQTEQNVVVVAKVKVLKAGDCYSPELKGQLLDADKNPIADLNFEMTYESKETLSANLKQADNVVSLKFGQYHYSYPEKELAEKIISEMKEKAKYFVLTSSDGRVTPIEEEQPKEAEMATAGGSYTMTGTVAGKQVGAMFEIAESGIVRGGYHYGKGTSGDMIELKGSFDASDNSMVVKEEYNGKVTGTWDLTLTTEPDGSATLTGTMTNFKGNTYPVNLSTGDSEMSVATSSDDNNIDALLDEYERYMSKMVSMQKKAMSGDMSALNDYQELMSTAESIDAKLKNVKGMMTTAQAARMAKIAQKAAGM